MKRILILVTVILIADGSCTWARPRCYFTNLGRIRYSPYAWGFGSNGLISEAWRHSPYTGGLVHETVRYTPYAFGTHHHGLISDAAGHYVPTLGWIYPHDVMLRQELIGALGELTRTIRQSRGNWAYAARPSPSRMQYTQSSAPKPAPRERRRTDPYHLVRQHLQQTMPGQLQVRRLLRIDGDVVSFDVLFKHSNTVIKYWNPDKVAALRGQADRREKALDRYLKSWAQYGHEHEKKGGAVYHLSSNDSEQVIAKLTTFSEWKPGYAVAKR